jgi:hypothetical protein
MTTLIRPTLLRLFIAICVLFASHAHAEKPNLVLLPLDLPQELLDLESEFGTSLQQGLLTDYTVFYGVEVERALEKEYSKLDCTAESCNQNIAIAFNGELVADASIKAVSSGYITKLVIRNVLTDQTVLAKTSVCSVCDEIALIANMIALGQSEQLVSPANNRFVSPTPSTSLVPSTRVDETASEVLDTALKPVTVQNTSIELVLAPDRFQILEDGEVIRDTLTNLEWMRCTVGMSFDGHSCIGIPEELTLDEAARLGIQRFGFSSWRLPFVSELASLTYCSTGSPAFYSDGVPCNNTFANFARPTIEQSFFSKTEPKHYWTFSNFSGNAYHTVSFGSGEGKLARFPAPMKFFVRMVRSSGT